MKGFTIYWDYNKSAPSMSHTQLTALAEKHGLPVTLEPG